MYRIDATCRKHSTHHNMLVVMLKKYKWNIAVLNKVCRINAVFETMTEAKESKKVIETELQKLERQLKPIAGYHVIFSNAYWLDPKKV